MIKTVLISALVCLASAQNLQSIIAQANAALVPFTNQANAISQHGNDLVIDVNNYEYVLTEFANEISAEQLNSNPNNLAPALATLLANVGNVAQINSNGIENILNSEAQNLGIEVQDNSAIVAAAGQLQDNAETIAQAAGNNYGQAAAQVNQANGAGAVNVNNLVNAGVEDLNTNNLVNAGVKNLNANNLNALNNLNANSNNPVQVNGNLAPLTEAAANAAGNYNPENAASDLGGLANQAAGAAGNSVPENVAGAVSNVAGNAADQASNNLNVAANTLNADAVNNLGSAASLANGAQ